MNLYYAAAHLCRYMNLERQAPPGPPPGPPGVARGTQRPVIHTPAVKPRSGVALEALRGLGSKDDRS